MDILASICTSLPIALALFPNCCRQLSLCFTTADSSHSPLISKMLHTWKCVGKMLAWRPGLRVGCEVQAEVSGEDVLFSDQPNMKDTWENVVAAMRLKMYLPIYKDKGSIEKKPLLLHRAFQHGRHSNMGGPMLTRPHWNKRSVPDQEIISYAQHIRKCTRTSAYNRSLSPINSGHSLNVEPWSLSGRGLGWRSAGPVSFEHERVPRAAYCTETMRMRSTVCMSWVKLFQRRWKAHSIS